MYRFTATGRHNVTRKSKKPFNSAISFNPPLPSSDSGIAVSSMASQLLPDPSGEAQPADGASSAPHQGLEGGQRRMGREGGKDSGGSAQAAAQDLGLGPPALPGPGLWQHPVLVTMPPLPAGRWHGGEPPHSLSLPCL